MNTPRQLKDELVKQFRDEFGIHFKDSAGELEFACGFIEDTVDKAIKVASDAIMGEITVASSKK